MSHSCSTLSGVYYLMQTRQRKYTARKKHKVSKSNSALTKPSASLFHHHPPTSLFFSFVPSLALWSPAVFDSLSALKSSLSLLACQAADGTNSYLRFWTSLLPPITNLSPSLTPNNPLPLYSHRFLLSPPFSMLVPNTSPFTTFSWKTIVLFCSCSGNSKAYGFVCGIWSPLCPTAGDPG